jgi:hypothetical protein
MRQDWRWHRNAGRFILPPGRWSGWCRQSYCTASGALSTRRVPKVRRAGYLVPDQWQACNPAAINACQHWQFARSHQPCGSIWLSSASCALDGPRHRWQCTVPRCSARPSRERTVRGRLQPDGPAFRSGRPFRKSSATWSRRRASRRSSANSFPASATRRAASKRSRPPRPSTAGQPARHAGGRPRHP